MKKLLLLLVGLLLVNVVSAQIYFFDVVSRVYLYKYPRGSYDGFSWYRQGMIVIGGVSMDDPGLLGLLRHEVMHLWALNHGLYGLSTYDDRELLVDELVNR